MKMTTTIPLVLSIAMLAFSGVGCDSEHQVGDDPIDAGSTAQGLEIQNLVASIAREYQCAAGFIGGYDDVSSCSCDTNQFDCDFSPAVGGPCVCDAMCYQSRPMIACADYSITFRIDNGDDRRIDRMTRISVRVGELELKEGGLECDGTMWSISSDRAGEIIQLDVVYDSSKGNNNYASADFNYPCYSGGSRVSDGGNSSSDELGSPLPPAVSVGSDAIVTIEGLFEDGSPWKLEATAQLQ